MILQQFPFMSQTRCVLVQTFLGFWFYCNILLQAVFEVGLEIAI